MPVPSRKRFEEVDALRRSSIERSGLRPGTYTELKGDLYGSVTAVYDDLVRELLDSLRGLDAVDLCFRLYKIHEEILGNILKVKHQSLPDIMLGNPAQSTRQILGLWDRLSHLTEPIRWLIEITVKHCGSSGIRAGNARVEYLITLAHAISEWDGAWEYVSCGVVPHEVVVLDDFTIGTEAIPRTSKAWAAHRQALQPYLVKADREWAELSMQPQQRSTDIEQVASLPEFEKLSQPLETERGYSIADWVRFTWGLVDSFGDTEYCKLTKVTRLARFLAEEWNLPSDRLTNLLVDHGLSRETVADVEMDKLRPMEHARRDSRLLRRPVVVLDNFGKPVCIYGVETTEAYVRLFADRLISGRIGIPLESGGPLNSAIRGIQTGLGNFFRDEIEKRCIDNGYQVRREKNKVVQEAMPQGGGFGPVDVFVVDRVHRRFVLAEAKDVADEGTVPKLIGREFTEFLGAVDKLNRQVAWFEDRLDALKAEYDISPSDDYSVEGVIVVSRPRIWMYSHTERLPIVDERNFFRILMAGERFQTDPVPL